MKRVNYKIAIVEDSKLVGNLLVWELSQNSNYTVELFETGEEFLLQKWFNPDLVILDYELNGVVEHASDGFKVMEKLGQIPVIVMSSQTNIQVALRFIRKGICDYIIKNTDIVANVAKSVDAVFSYCANSEEIKKLKCKKKNDFGRLGLFVIAFLLIGAFSIYI